ncbi:MAG: hypothetical protein ABSF67_07895 [Roseiarcus sp.]|jgi:hypothetical protein
MGELEEVPLRVVWPHETQRFTPWLAANIDKLAEAIGIPLLVLGAEAQVDGVVVDLLARNLRDGSIAVIESQLEPADFSHLGQILAYQAGLDARTVIWIAASFKERHLSAIRWLNANTSSSFAFFAVRMRALRIGASPIAPAFDVLECPVVGGRTLLRVASKGAAKLAATNPLGAFWGQFLERYRDEAARSRQLGERCRWRTTLRNIVVGQQVQDRCIRVFVRGREGVAIATVMKLLAPHREALEAQLSASLTIENSCVTATKRLGFETSDPANWSEMADWLRAQSDNYEAVLRSTLESLAPDGNRQRRRDPLRERSRGRGGKDCAPPSGDIEVLNRPPCRTM